MPQKFSNEFGKNHLQESRNFKEDLHQAFEAFDKHKRTPDILIFLKHISLLIESKSSDEFECSLGNEGISLSKSHTTNTK